MTLKQTLFNSCLNVVEQRISHAQLALDAARQAGNDESKSTVGDKHETAKAMAQIEQENTGKQLQEAQKLKNTLLKINPTLSSDKALTGSIIITDKSNFYLSIAAGKIEAEGKLFFALSPASPIGQKLLGLKSGDSLKFNEQVYKIKEVY